MQHAAKHSTHSADHSGAHHYAHLAIMAGLSFVVMFALMYAMVNAFGNVFVNINQVYMAGLMAAPMVVIELVVMRGMYRDKKRNALIIGLSVLLAVAFWMGIRQQVAVGDAQFLRSMIPHHAGAILMCNETSATDAEIKSLCTGIVNGQQREIDQMKAILSRLRTSR